MRLLGLAIAAAVCAFGGLGGCTSTARPDALSHYVLVQPARSAAGTPPMFLVGIEKYSAEIVGRHQIGDRSSCGRTCLDLASSPTGKLERLWSAALEDRTQMVVSHIASITPTSCELVVSGLSNQSCPLGSGRPDPEVSQGWKLLNNDLSRALDTAIHDADATHVIVFAPGWNSTQEGSIEIFGDWARGITAALGPDARPIFVGVTWPAARRGLPYIHFFNKAHDSDETGFTWANVLINETLAGLRNDRGVRVVLVGHSFGARLLSDAAFSGWAIGSSCESAGPDLLIGLLPAYSTSRLIGDRPPDARVFHHARDCRGVTAFVASRHDDSVPMAPSQIFSSTTAYLGGRRALDITDRSPFFDHAVADASGDVAPPSDAKVLMVDASAFVTSHRDVRDAETARLIARLISAYAPTLRP